MATGKNSGGLEPSNVGLNSFLGLICLKWSCCSDFIIASESGFHWDFQCYCTPGAYSLLEMKLPFFDLYSQAAPEHSSKVRSKFSHICSKWRFWFGVKPIVNLPSNGSKNKAEVRSNYFLFLICLKWRCHSGLCSIWLGPRVILRRKIIHSIKWSRSTLEIIQGLVVRWV